MFRHLAISLLASFLLLALPAWAQQPTGTQAKPDPRAPVASDGLVPLLPVTADSPMDTIYFADRGRTSVDTEAAGAGDQTERSTGLLVEAVLPAGPGGTGTDKTELFWYQLPATVPYNPTGPAHPMVIAWHGFGQSAASVHVLSDIDEECDARGWVYVSVTGIDDQLFGSPISQQNAEAAIQWMLDNFNVDPDRLYMAGFSMGGGVVSNFTARRRDPNGLRIAALGIVSGGHDWTFSYNTGGPALQATMEGAYNFGTSPTVDPFAYQQASALYYDPATYPPAPGTMVSSLSMATNLHDTPVYLTWDTLDTLPHIPSENADLANMLLLLGDTIETRVVAGTIDPDTGLPATHSWVVLDEVDLFDFFDGRVADRSPAEFEAQIDLDGATSYVTLTQATPGTFSYADGVADAVLRTVVVDNVSNASDLVLDLRTAAMTGTSPVHVTATSADANGFRLHLSWFAQPPSYLLDWGTGSLVTGTGSDPQTDSLWLDVDPFSTLEVQVISEPWLGELMTSPNPAPIGSAMDLTFYGPTGSPTLWLILGFSEVLIPIKGGFKMTVQMWLPLILPLDANGDTTFPGLIPNDPGFQGLRVLMQGVTLGPTAVVTSVSNMWGLEIQ